MAAVPVKWLGYCDLCGEPSPEERESQSEAEEDAAMCPCLAETPDEEEGQR